MSSVTNSVVQPFIRNEDGIVAPIQATEAPSAEAARRMASSVAPSPCHVGAVAFARTGSWLCGT